MVQAASLEEEPCKEGEELSCSAGEALAGTPVGGAGGQGSSENEKLEKLEKQELFQRMSAVHFL